MEYVSPMETPQGALFVCALPEEKPLAVRPGMVLLDGVQDPGNLGTILRTADAMEIPVVLLEGCADPYSHKVVRASMGAVLSPGHHWMASVRSLVPSATNRPSSTLALREESSFRTRWIVAFLREVSISIIISVPGSAPDCRPR